MKLAAKHDLKNLDVITVYWKWWRLCLVVMLYGFGSSFKPVTYLWT